MTCPVFVMLIAVVNYFIIILFSVINGKIRRASEMPVNFRFMPFVCFRRNTNSHFFCPPLPHIPLPPPNRPAPALPLSCPCPAALYECLCFCTSDIPAVCPFHADQTIHFCS